MHKLLRFILVICAAPLLAPPAKGEVRVPSIIGDNMVVQQGLKACLWGTAQPGERVTVSIAGRTVRAITDAQGQSGQELALHLTAIDDFDITYFNGTRVGATGNETPNSYMVPRRYTVPGSLVHAGRNVIAVRVFDRAGEGGFGRAGSLSLAPVGAQETEAISLAGPWIYKIELSFEPKTPDYGSRPELPGPTNQNSPSVLYNAMIAPLRPFAIRGAIWYQGEREGTRRFDLLMVCFGQSPGRYCVSTSPNSFALAENLLAGECRAKSCQRES